MNDHKDIISIAFLITLVVSIIMICLTMADYGAFHCYSARIFHFGVAVCMGN